MRALLIDLAAPAAKPRSELPRAAEPLAASAA